MLFILLSAILPLVNAGQMRAEEEKEAVIPIDVKVQTVEIPSAPVIKVLAPPRIRYEYAKPKIISVEQEIRYVTPPTIQLKPDIIRIHRMPQIINVEPEIRYVTPPTIHLHPKLTRIHHTRTADLDVEVNYKRKVGRFRHRSKKSRGRHSRVKHLRAKPRSHGRSRISGEITLSHSSDLKVEIDTGSLEFDVWLVFRRRHYMVKRNAESFDDAEANCRKLGAHLVSIHSEAENNFIHKITADGHHIKSFNDFVYIGLRLKSRNRWEWTDGSAFNYKKWAVHQPDLPDREKCAQFHQGPARLLYVQDYHWNSISCGRHMKYYVCKK